MLLALCSVAIFITVFLIIYNIGQLKPYLAGTASIQAAIQRIKFLETEYGELLNDMFIAGVNPLLLAYLHFFRHAIAFILAWVSLGPFIAVLLAAGVHFFPGMIINRMKKKRWHKLDDQLPDCISMIAASVRAGMTLVQSIENLAKNAPKPSSDEFGLMLKQYEHGRSLEQVLESAPNRIPTDNFHIVATALRVNREKGGNLSEVLDKIATSVKEISRLHKKIQTETASVRFSANIMMFMPLVIGFFFYMIEPDSITLLFTHPVGNILLGVAILLNVVAYLTIRHIVNADI